MRTGYVVQKNLTSKTMTKYNLSNNFNFNSIDELGRHFAEIIASMERHSIAGILPGNIAGKTWDIEVNHTYEDLKEELINAKREEDLTALDLMMNF